MERIKQLAIKIFADGADFDAIVRLRANPLIKGFTTNPTLARNAGVNDYEEFGRRILAAVPDRPVSLEVLADEFAEMLSQARIIASWGKNVNVKIPVTNTRKEFSGDVIRALSTEGVVVNITAIMTLDQIAAWLKALPPTRPRSFRFCRADRRYRRRSDAADGRSPQDPRGTSKGRTVVGKPARTAQRFSGRSGRLSHHHCHERCARKACLGRQGSRCLFAGDCRDVPAGRACRGFRDR